MAFAPSTAAATVFRLEIRGTSAQGAVSVTADVSVNDLCVGISVMKTRDWRTINYEVRRFSTR